ncbi:MAG: LTA synthase family protein [Gemmiger sp.]|uniref:LTA synthase family protein n=1 Tax=Gemmiger sp. TaxID=2049027 RepID=UPI002E768C4F|nr:LTA synthase family protein [Gemmiger sp.]MEE0799906.1 LTA synthase family protein [Gemmiger sp.]
MESIDDWMVNDENTPTISKMMREGINFLDMYTPCYGSGWTFGTEFAFQTGVYQGATTMAGGRLARNAFPYSIADLAGSLGYSCKSFHENTGNYYNRTSMHSVLGYTYYCTAELVSDGNPMDDTTLVTSDEVWNLLTDKMGKENFLSFIITYSPHLPYSTEDELGKYALSRYPQYNVEGRDSEINILCAKARLTDDMFSQMLIRLEAAGLLDETVIIAYTDHYSYGITDQEQVKELSRNNGNEILERTPAFIWFQGCEPTEVQKTCQTIDWLPTIANMLGVDMTSKSLGYDIFDPEYQGLAVLPDHTWVSNGTYVKNGTTIARGNMTDEEIAQMNEWVQKFYSVDDAVLRSDYYRTFR